MDPETRSLLLDLWFYATGSAWGEMEPDDAAAESETLEDLYRRMRAALEEK